MHTMILATVAQALHCSCLIVVSVLMTVLGLLESSMLENDARPEMAVDQFQVDFRCHGVSTVGITETT